MITRAIEAFRPPDPDTRVEHWHVSPGIDTLAYAFSWLWMLIPFWMSGPTHPSDYMWFWIVGNALSTSHRHLTMPYVYMDRQVFGTQPGRFLVIPALLLAGFLFSGLYRGWTIPRGFFTLTDMSVGAMGLLLLLQWRRLDQLRTLPHSLLFGLTALPLVILGGLLVFPAGFGHASHSLTIGIALLGAACWMAWEGRKEASPFVNSFAPGLAVVLLFGAVLSASADAVALGPSSRMRMPLVTGAVAAFAGAWNIWHVFMQKYGILRMYAAKSGLPRERWVPGWVDRFLVFGWVPAYFMYLPGQARPILQTHAQTVLHWLDPILLRLEALAVVGLPLTLAIGASSVVIYFWHEHAASGLRNPARMMMGTGTVLLALAFFLIDPFKAYVAYGFSHAVEYCVFVWAFQRRRYRTPLAHRPLIGSLLRSPFLFYGVFFLVVGGLYAGLEYGSGTLYEGRLSVAGTPVRSWIFYWTVWHSMTHFYFDSFLWKMRLPEVRASL